MDITLTSVPTKSHNHGNHTALSLEAFNQASTILFASTFSLTICASPSEGISTEGNFWVLPKASHNMSKGAKKPTESKLRRDHLMDLTC
jgi:hypothetical protein